MGKSSSRKSTYEWVKYKSLKHTLKNEKDFPLAVWAFAQKS